MFLRTISTTEITPPGDHPQTEWAVSMDYLPSADQLVLGIGQTQAGTRTLWTYDGTSWHFVQDVPTPTVHLAAVVVDPLWEVAVLMGNRNTGSMFTWDGTALLEHPSAESPSDMGHGAGAYDTTLQMPVFYFCDETWAFGWWPDP